MTTRAEAAMWRKCAEKLFRTLPKLCLTDKQSDAHALYVRCCHKARKKP